MSTHRRAWKQRAGVVVALIVGALLTVPATPALAADPGVQITNLATSSLTSGQKTSMTFAVKNNNGEATSFSINVDTFNGLNCQGECNIPARQIPPNQTAEVTVTLVAESVPAGETQSGKVRVSAKAGGDQGSDERDMSVRGPAPQPTQAQTVQSVSGKVVNQATGESVPNAVVILQDASGKKFDTVTDNNGNFRFTGTTSNPIAPGRLDLGATFDNIYATKSFNASAGQAITGQRIALAIKTEVTPSVTPSESVEAFPTEEVTEEGTEESADAAAGAQANAGDEDSGGMGSLLIILLGGLLVAAGVGTIVLLLMRRKEDGDEAEESVGPAAAGGPVPAVRSAYRGADDHTRVVNPAAAAPTMVGGGGLTDAPTMMHRPMIDDVPPDPYGAPPQSYGAPAGQGGWAGSGYGDEPGGYGAGGYGNAPSSGGGYGNAPSSGGGYGNAPSSGGGYGTPPSSGGGYGGNDYGAPVGAPAGPGYPPTPGGAHGYGERYDEPTGRYQGDATQYPAPADPYATGTYQQDAGYGQPEPAPYGRGGEPTGGYDQRGGYDQGGYGGYGQEPPAQRGGYDDRGYDQGGYGGGYGGYGQEPPPQRGGYGDRGYDQGGYGGGYGDPTQAGRGRPDGPPQDRGGRRLDWLDD